MWITELEAVVKQSLVDSGYLVDVKITPLEEQAPFPQTPPHSVIGAYGEACCPMVICHINAGPLTEQLYQNEAVDQRILSEIEDRLPPDWRCHLTFIFRDPKTGEVSEWELPRLGQAHFGHFQLMKKNTMHTSERWKSEAIHPLVHIFLDDVRAAATPFLSNDAWKQIRPLLEQKWRKRLRYQVGKENMITEEDWELVLNSISYLFEKLGLPELNSRSMPGDRGFSTHTEADNSN